MIVSLITLKKSSCSRYPYYPSSFIRNRSNVLCRFKSCLQFVGLAYGENFQGFFLLLFNPFMKMINFYHYHNINIQNNHYYMLSQANVNVEFLLAQMCLLFLHISCFTNQLHISAIKLDTMCVHAEAVTRRCSVKKGILRNFAKFTEKHLCHSLFFNKVAGLSLQLY